MEIHLNLDWQANSEDVRFGKEGVGALSEIEETPGPHAHGGIESTLQRPQPEDLRTFKLIAVPQTCRISCRPVLSSAGHRWLDQRRLLLPCAQLLSFAALLGGALKDVCLPEIGFPLKLQGFELSHPINYFCLDCLIVCNILICGQGETVPRHISRFHF